ncbi:hypothetical protein [Massilia sp. TN1-12]|uniref:hypothetical protein n=1 Tax=Massilia paldalensis TaxID=3377675 RepID=UPI003850447D
MSAAYDVTDEMIRQVVGMGDPYQAIMSLMDRVGMRHSHTRIEAYQEDGWVIGGPHARMAILVYWRAMEQLREPELCC